MKFEFVMKVSPAGPFGVPDGSRIIVPGVPGRQIVGPAVHVRTMRPFGYGTLPEYRRDDDAVKVEMEHEGVHLHVQDNYFVFAVAAEDVRSAYRVVKPVIERLMRILTMEHGGRFSYEGDYVEGEDESLAPWPEGKKVTMFEGTMYNTRDLQDRITEGFPRAFSADVRCDRALAYFENAIALRDLAVAAAFDSTRASMLQALAFLQLWKALTTILGEPGTDKDYQRRFKDYGLPENYWKDTIEPLNRIRNDEDVAHYSLSESTAAEVAKVFGEAVVACQTVLRAYISHLQPST